MASSVASATASNKGDNSSSDSQLAGELLGAAGWAENFVTVENAITKSPLPLLPEEPLRASPKMERLASRCNWRESIGASVATTIMHEPSAELRFSLRALDCSLGGCNSR